MIPPIKIVCEGDEGVERLRLTEFPFPPAAGDRIIIDGVEFEVVRREFKTEHGTIDARGHAAVILKRLD